MHPYRKPRQSLRAPALKVHWRCLSFLLLTPTEQVRWQAAGITPLPAISPWGETARHGEISLSEVHSEPPGNVGRRQCHSTHQAMSNCWVRNKLPPCDRSLRSPPTAVPGFLERRDIAGDYFDRPLQLSPNGGKQKGPAKGPFAFPFPHGSDTLWQSGSKKRGKMSRAALTTSPPPSFNR